MRIVVVGGAGLVALPVIDEALARGHEVTWIARILEAVVPRQGLQAVAREVYRREELVNLVRGHDIVIGAFDVDWKNPNLYDEYVRGARSVLGATKEAGVARLLWVGGAGTLEVAPGVRLVDTPEFPAKFKAGALAAGEALRLLQEERELDWTVLSPPVHLDEGPRTALYRIGGDTPVYGANRDSHISARDLAVALLDEVERPRHHRHRFTVGY